MDAYAGFAQVYDRLMEDVDYDKWVDYIFEIFKKYNVSPSLVAELGCGTGNITNRLAKAAIEMIGVDISEEMLGIARKKAVDADLDVLYLCQDMREFELYGTVDVILSLCDSINYITEKDDLLEVFKLVNNYLEPKGLFVFDLNTEYKFKNILADNVFAQSDDDISYIWENNYDEDEKINEYYVNFFIKDKNEKYEKVEECHYERAYCMEEIKGLVEESGMDLIDVFDAFTFEKPKSDSQRIYVIAREKGK